MFIGREEELKLLKRQAAGRSARFIAIKGRRRIGKSYLIEEFSNSFSKKYLFTGIPPTPGVTSQSQREEFIQQMVGQGLPNIKGNDWSEIFSTLSKEVQKGKVLIALDEISWMGSKDPVFLGKLKIAWDRFFEKNPKLILIVASSISGWIDKNILNNTGFFGRVDLTLNLRELSISECSKFWGKREKSISPFEKLKVLNVTGGVPKYLDAIDPKLTAEENIKRLCFTESGLLFNEFNRIFHELFSRRSEVYKDIVEALSSNHSLYQEEICSKIGRENGRVISEYLKDLTEAGFLSADFTWDIKTFKISKLRKYRLSDNYLRFYLKYIVPNKQQVFRGKFKSSSLYTSTQWESIMGFQFENLVIHNSHELLEKLNICSSDYVFDGPFFQTRTKARKGCQIDYLIQCKDTLYPCEIKFSKNPVGMEVVEETKKKLSTLSIPRLFSLRPVLIHIGGCTQQVIEEDYFDHIIDWTELL
ncbi:AAA family ATPase [Candidatus Neptunochlamydia vexilliferae]|nr:ATP-binding protein [Candidatus Neptunochlamydia vexilliferae]